MKKTYILEDQAMCVTIKMYHAHYEEQDPDRPFFMIEAFRGSV